MAHGALVTGPGAGRARRREPEPAPAGTRAAIALGVVLGIAPSLVADPAGAAAPARPAPTRGAFAFHYAYRLTERDLRWLGRFRVVVLARALPAAHLAHFQRARTTLFLYEWLTGFYRDAHTGPWEDRVVQSRPDWLLNPEGPEAGPDGRGRAYYYDPAAPDFPRAWASETARRLRAASVPGIFLDLVGHLHVPERLRARYAERHPETPFDQALARQIRALRRARPATLVFTNQGHREPEAYLPLADYDLSESLMTSTEGGEAVEVLLEGRGRVKTRETFYRSWSALERILAAIDADARRHNPRVRLFHLNYVAPRLEPTGRARERAGARQPVFREVTDRAAIHYAYAVAKLWGHESFSALDGVRAARDGIYFADLGRPLGATWEERDGLVARYYEKGVAVVNPSEGVRTASLGSPLLPPDFRDLWDCYEEKPVGGLAVTIEPTRSAATGRRYPAGRIYLHLR